MLRLDFSTPSARRLRTFNTLLLPEDLEIPSDEAFATFQPSKGTSKVYSRFSQGLSFFEGLDSPRSFGSAALFFDERKSLTFIVWGECRSSKFSLVPERHLKWCSQRGGSSKFSGWVGVLREDFISGSPHAVVDDGSVGALSGAFRKRKTGTYEKCPSKKLATKSPSSPCMVKVKFFHEKSLPTYFS